MTTILPMSYSSNQKIIKPQTLFRFVHSSYSMVWWNQNKKWPDDIHSSKKESYYFHVCYYPLHPSCRWRVKRIPDKTKQNKTKNELATARWRLPNSFFTCRQARHTTRLLCVCMKCVALTPTSLVYGIYI